MRLAPLLLVLAATTLARADDDPDLAVVSGRVAKDAPGDVHLRLHQRQPCEGGGWQTGNAHFDVTTRPGDAFRFANLTPARYELVVDGDGLSPSRRDIDVFGDVADVVVQRDRATRIEDASVSGTWTLGAGVDVTKCAVTISGVPVARYPDGTFRCVALHAGEAWMTVRNRQDGWSKQDTSWRHVPLKLVAGENHADLRIDPDEDVRLVLRPEPPRTRLDARIVNLDPSPWPNPRGETIAVEAHADGSLHARRWRYHGTDSSGFDDVGPDFRLRNMPRGPHKLRIEAEGYDPQERAFDVDGPTRLVVDLKPRAGEFVDPVIDGECRIVEERTPGGSWERILVSDVTPHLGMSNDIPPPPHLFLPTGRHEIRAVKEGAPPSAPVTIEAASDRSTRRVEFVFPDGHSLVGSMATPGGKPVTGFAALCFVKDGDRWQRLPAQDAIVGTAFRIHGLAPGNYRLAFDEEGRHVIGEFEMKDADVEREFVWRAR